MYILYYNSYLVKVATKGWGGMSKFQKSGYVVFVWPPIGIFFQKSYKVGIIELVILGVSNVRTMIWKKLFWLTVWQSEVVPQAEDERQREAGGRR